MLFSSGGLRARVLGNSTTSADAVRFSLLGIWRRLLLLLLQMCDVMRCVSDCFSFSACSATNYGLMLRPHQMSGMYVMEMRDCSDESMLGG